MSKNNMSKTMIELCIFSIVNKELCVLVSKSEEDSAYSLPHGAVRVDLDIDPESAARRISMDHLELDLPSTTQEHTVGGRDRDGNWTIGIVYRAAIREESLLKLKTTRWLPVNEVKKLPRNNAEIIKAATSSLRQDVEMLHMPFSLLPKVFRFAELHEMCEKILDRKLEQSRLRKRLDASLLLMSVHDIYQGTKGRPAALFKERPKNAIAQIAKTATMSVTQAAPVETPILEDGLVDAVLAHAKKSRSENVSTV